MSKEEKLHELIEQQNPEEKQRGIERVLQREREKAATKPTPPLPVAKPFPWKRVIAIVAPSITAVCFGIFAIAYWKPFSPITQNSSSSEEEKDRYCDGSQYTVIDVSKTIKEYSKESGKNLLYFDWYDQTEHLTDSVYQLNDTQEIICYREIITDINTGSLITLYITDSITTIDSLTNYEIFEDSSLIKDITVKWQINRSTAYSYFQYNGFKYYLELSDPIDESHILTVTELLFE